MSEQRDSPSSVKLFFSYAHEDELLRNELEKHLSLLQRRGVSPPGMTAKLCLAQIGHAPLIPLMEAPSFSC